MAAILPVTLIGDNMSKPTLATIKAFIRKHDGQLYIRSRSDFNGMTDCVEQCENRSWRLAETAPAHMGKNTLGIRGAWFVFQSRDSIRPIIDNGYTGYHVYNCCGSFDLAIRN